MTLSPEERLFWQKFGLRFEVVQLGKKLDQFFTPEEVVEILRTQLSHRVRQLHTGSFRRRLTPKQAAAEGKKLARELRGGQKGPGRPRGAMSKKKAGGEHRLTPYRNWWVKGRKEPELYRYLRPWLSDEEYMEYFDKNLTRTFRRWDANPAVALSAKRRAGSIVRVMKPHIVVRPPKAS